MPDRMPVESQIRVFRMLASIRVDPAQAVSIELAEDGDSPRSKQELERVQCHERETRHAFRQTIDIAIPRIPGGIVGFQLLYLPSDIRQPLGLLFAQGKRAIVRSRRPGPAPIRELGESRPIL